MFSKCLPVPGLWAELNLLTLREASEAQSENERLISPIRTWDNCQRNNQGLGFQQKILGLNYRDVRRHFRLFTTTDPLAYGVQQNDHGCGHDDRGQ